LASQENSSSFVLNSYSEPVQFRGWHELNISQIFTLHVRLEVAEPREALVTARAGKGLESGVGKKVRLEVTAPTEGLVAMDTLVGLYSCR